MVDLRIYKPSKLALLLYTVCVIIVNKSIEEMQYKEHYTSYYLIFQKWTSLRMFYGMN